VGRPSRSAVSTSGLLRLRCVDVKEDPPSGDSVRAVKTVRFVAAAIIVRANQVLICQRRIDQAMALKWEFPGGKIEPGENAEEALHRELEEELGIDATIGRRITQTRHIYRSGGAIHLQFFLVETFAGELTNRIFNDVRWSLLRELPRYDFLAADRALIRDLAAGKLL
jgi:8-oxo-dGTP diphosphatase